jgi:hypothetical protein
VDTIGGLRRKRVAGKKRCEREEKFGFHRLFILVMNYE